ncbi:MAG: EamA family transporter [Alphaproteobacteria bacterium]
MAPVVFVAVVGAAFLHAIWNALIKNSGDPSVTMTALVFGHVPLAVIVLPFVPMPDLAALPYLAVGLVFHAGYQIFLLLAYRAGDLTQVYPIARGSAPMLVAGVSVVFLGVELSSLELVAILTIGAGILSLAAVRQGDGLRNGTAAGLAFITGCFIAGYSLVDGNGARVAGTALGYLGWLMTGNAIVFAIIMRIFRPDVLGRVAREGKRAFFIGGAASYTAYGLVMWSFTQAPIALVTALRETSIIFALFIGVFLLGEKLNLAKVFSTMVTLIGAALLRFAR